jgi:Domain of unknown function (DUF4350)
MAKHAKTIRRLLYFGLGLLIMLVILSLYIPRTAYPPYTTHSPKSDGTKAMFLLLNKEGFRASQLLAPVPQGQGLMIIVEPETSLGEQDWQQVLAWVDRGNTLFLASGSQNDLYKHFGYEIIKAPGGFGTQHVSSESPLLKDVRELTISGGTRLKEHQSMAFAYGDEQGIYLAESVQGQGRIVFLTMPDLLTNKEIDQKDNLILLLNIVRLYGQQGVLFNEFAHGYTWEKTARQVFTWPLRLVIIQFAIGVLLLYYFWGKRFGRPLPLPEDTSQVAGDYVSSLANIYRQGRARQLTLESIYQGFKHDLAKYLGVPKNLSNEALVKIFSGRPRIDTQKLADLLRRCAGLMGKPGISETDLFTMARDMETWREQNLISGLKRSTKHD